MIKKFLIAVLCIASSFSGNEGDEEVYKFAGKHFVASYLNCDEKAISDVEGLLEAMDKAVGASRATILDKSSYVFPPNGLTVVYLLSESHASLHTYPEFGACFVDLFTCGDTCSAEEFDAALRIYLKPKEVNARYFFRNEETHEIPLSFYKSPQEEAPASISQN